MPSTNFEDLIGRGATGAKPAASVPGRLYFDTTLVQMERDNGATWDAVEGAGTGLPTDGWVADGNTWSYSSDDAPSFEISIDADMTTMLAPGMRIKITQTSEKFFVITAVGAFGGGATVITVYGGTDYTLANAGITNPYYSPVKAPFGFPLDPAKWSVIVTDTTSRSQAAPVKNTWYNLGGAACQISAPIGIWHGSYKVTKYGYKSSAVTNFVQVTLSTANNTESDANWTTGGYSGGGSGTFDLSQTVFMSGVINVAVKTTLYLNCLWDRTASADGTSIQFMNDSSPMVLSLVCAYL